MYYVIALLVAMASITDSTFEMAHQYGDYLKSNNCVKQQVANGYHRSEIGTYKDTCYIKGE